MQYNDLFEEIKNRVENLEKEKKRKEFIEYRSRNIGKRYYIIKEVQIKELEKRLKLKKKNNILYNIKELMRNLGYHLTLTEDNFAENILDSYSIYFSEIEYKNKVFNMTRKYITNIIKNLEDEDFLNFIYDVTGFNYISKKDRIKNLFNNENVKVIDNEEISKLKQEILKIIHGSLLIGMNIKNDENTIKELCLRHLNFLTREGIDSQNIHSISKASLEDYLNERGFKEIKELEEIAIEIYKNKKVESSELRSILEEITNINKFSYLMEEEQIRKIIKNEKEDLENKYKLILKEKDIKKREAEIDILYRRIKRLNHYLETENLKKYLE